MRECPKCKRKYSEHPAISRVDNKTKICTPCGVAESIVIMKSEIVNEKIEIRTDSLTKEEAELVKHFTSD